MWDYEIAAIVGSSVDYICILYLFVGYACVVYLIITTYLYREQ